MPATTAAKEDDHHEVGLTTSTSWARLHSNPSSSRSCHRARHRSHAWQACEAAKLCSSVWVSAIARPSHVQPTNGDHRNGLARSKEEDEDEACTDVQINPSNSRRRSTTRLKRHKLHKNGPKKQPSIVTRDSSQSTARCLRLATSKPKPLKGTFIRRPVAATVQVILFYCLVALCIQRSPLMMITSAEEGELFERAEPEAQPLVYMMRELGSGDGLGGYSRTSSSASFGDSTTSTDNVSPALIEARCWNNYDNDNDCKQLNVITAPVDSNESPTNGQARNQQPSQEYNQQQQEDDRLITPVVIFEASSSIEPPLDGQRAGGDLEPERPVFMAPPYHSSSSSSSLDSQTQQQPKPHRKLQYDTGNDGSYAASTRTPPTNVNRDNPSRDAASSPVTRPSVIHYVVTPQPKTRRPAATAKTKTTTQGRKCRDENDADCDEPEDNQIQPISSSSSKADGDGDNEEDENDDDDKDGEEDDTSKTQASSSLSSLQTNLIDANEAGSGAGYGGAGPSDDDTDDSTDDGDEDDSASSESSGANSIQDNINNNNAGGGSSRPTDETTKDSRLLVITSSFPTMSSTVGATQTSVDQEEPSAPSTISTRRPQSGAAEIEVVVHSTLPPSFPSLSNGGQMTKTNTIGYGEFSDPASTNTTTTTTTMMPDDTFTSRPIFPSSTPDSVASTINSPNGDADNGNANNEQSATAANQAGQTTTELDLYTFKPIPIPVESSEVRPSRFESSQMGSSNQVGGPTSDVGASPSGATAQQSGNGEHEPKQQEVSSQHIHEPAGHRRIPSSNYDRSLFDDGWTTRKPANTLLGSLSKDSFGNQEQPDMLIGGNGGKRTSSKAYTSQLGHDILSQMLLYASITIVVFTSLIVVIIAYIFRRRNNFRRQAMLAKAQMMNGRPPGMIESMSHVSHLMHGADGLPPPQPPQQGLLSTYAQAKGSSIGKVTTSLVKPGMAGEHRSANNGLLIDPDLDDLEDGQGEAQEERQQLRRNYERDSTKDQLNADEESMGIEDNQPQQARQGPGLIGGVGNGGMMNDSMHNQSGSWSTEDPTTTTTSSGSQRTQDSQQMMQNQQQAGAQSASRTHNPYPNSLSDGRQNSSSISDSQCSPDPGPSGQSMAQQMQHMQQPATMAGANHQAPHMAALHGDQQLARHGGDMMMAPSPNQNPLVAGQIPFAQHSRPPPLRTAFRTPNGGSGPAQLMGLGGSMGPPHHGQAFHPMLMHNGDMGGGLKQRIVASRSIEDIQTSQHVGFVETGNNAHAGMNASQHNVPYNPLQQPPPHVLPHLIQARPQYQQQHPAAVSMAANSMLRNNASMISPQRIAMSPLATLSRRFPPGSGLNRNIYSLEDSSSFMTTSPSLARTSSSSSFAFNMSNLPTPSSVKAAKPIVDASGRIFSNYTSGFNDHPTPSNTNGSSNGNGPTVPPIFGRNDRSEAWYV